VLHQPADLLTHTSTDQVAGVAQVDLCAAGGPERRVCMLRVCVGCDGVVLKPPVDLQYEGKGKGVKQQAAAREAAHMC
jgi:hypothetical protein